MTLQHFSSPSLSSQRTAVPTRAEKRWLTKEGLERALAALKKRRQQSKRTWKEEADTELLAAAGIETGREWNSLLLRLKRSGLAGSRDPETAIQLAACLLGLQGKSIDCICTNEAPEDEPENETPNTEVSAAPPADSRLRINCPDTVYGHQTVLLGVLPAPGLWPAVFVQPLDDGGCFWYPQVGRHNPLIQDTAFACMVSFGNPCGIWHERPLPADYRVRVYALKERWSCTASERLSDSELELQLAKHTVVDTFPTFGVTRPKSVVTDVTISHGKTKQPVTTPKIIKCKSPVRIEWKGEPNARIEVRSGIGDRELCENSVSSPAILAFDPPRSKRAFVQLPEPGRYRVRLYPATKWAFVGPAHEWWLDVS
jgi:hypothetical protein